LPIAWQMADRHFRMVPVHYVIANDETVSLSIGAYDPALPLIIDPSLTYSTVLGAANSSIQANAIAVDKDGSLYIAGRTSASTFPIHSAVKANKAGSTNAFVMKVSPAGNSIIYSTYLGGSDGPGSNPQGDNALAIAVDKSGNVVVAGVTD